MPSRSPISSFEQPAAISSTTSRWRAVIAGIAPLRVSYMMGATLTSVHPAPLLPERRIFAVLHGASGRGAADETRLVSASVRVSEAVFVERADPQQQLELVPQPRAHHLRPVRRDRERHLVLDERA